MTVKKAIGLIAYLQEHLDYERDCRNAWSKRLMSEGVTKDQEEMYKGFIHDNDLKIEKLSDWVRELEGMEITSWKSLGF